MILRALGLAAALSSALACSSPSETTTSATASSEPVATDKRPPPATPRATSRPGPSADPNAFQVPKLPLGIKVPEGTKASIEPKEKTTVIDFSGHELALVIAETIFDLEASKKKKAKEDVFKGWVMEGPDSAIAEVEIKGSKEFYGFAVKTIGDKMYECGTLTRRTRTWKNLDAVKQTLALCDGLVPR